MHIYLLMFFSSIMALIVSSVVISVDNVGRGSGVGVTKAMAISVVYMQQRHMSCTLEDFRYSNWIILIYR